MAEQATQAPRDPKSIGTVLVVGGCGFVGSHMIDQLLNFPSETPQSNTAQLGAGNESYIVEYPSIRERYAPYHTSETKVHALDLQCTRNRFDGCTYHEADITNTSQLVDVFRKVRPDVVINTASPSWAAPPAILRKVNVEGTRALLEVAGGKHGDWGGKCKVFVHTSSSSVVHDTLSDLKHADERYPYVCPNPREYYSETKVLAEKLVLEANDQEEFQGMLTAAVRPAGIIGPGDLGGITHGMLTTASVSPDWQLHIQLGDGDNLFDTTYVANVVYGHLLVVDALLETAKRKKSGNTAVLEHEKVDGEAFNVTNDEPTYFWEIARFLFSRYGRDIQQQKVWTLPEGFASIIGGFSELFGMISGRKGKITRQTVKYSCASRYFSCEKIKRRCGYRPLVGVEEGLGRTVKWFKEEELKDKRNSGTEKKTQ